MKKIIVFADALTYPPKEGITAHVFSLLESLNGTSVQPVLLLADRGFIASEIFDTFPWKTILVPADVFYDYPEVEALLDAEKPDILQSYNVYQARLIAGPYSLKRRIPLVMEHHDLESALSQFLGLNQSIAQSNLRTQYEVAGIASMNRVMSASDYASIQSEAADDRKARFVHLPVGIKDDFAQASWPQRSPTDVVFVGNCAYPPNRRAAEYIVTTLAKSLPGFTFHMIGRLTHQLANATQKNIKGYGMLDDLGPILEKALCGIVPISVGSGMKIKILTYLSAGLPVLGTPTAFHGYRPSPHFITSELADFAKNIQRLSETVQNSKANLRARKYFLDNYEVGRVTRRLEILLNNLDFCPSETAFDLKAITRDDRRLAWIHELRENMFPIVDQVTSYGGKA